MIDFLRENWKLILEAVVLIASVILLIVKKKPVKVLEGVINLLNRYVVSAINEAEATGLKGSDKKKYCHDILIGFAAASLGFDQERTNRLYGEYVDVLIENILSTPQKKGDNDGTKN